MGSPAEYRRRPSALSDEMLIPALDLVIEINEADVIRELEDRIPKPARCGACGFPAKGWECGNCERPIA